MNNQLIELNRLEIMQYTGGRNYFAYALGYIAGRAVAAVKGAYASGYDEAKKNCECS